ncbi:MAG: hypothetical protein ACJ72N_19175, partial [Labedaea sp.]
PARPAPRPPVRPPAPAAVPATRGNPPARPAPLPPVRQPAPPAGPPARAAGRGNPANRRPGPGDFNPAEITVVELSPAELTVVAGFRPVELTDPALSPIRVPDFVPDMSKLGPAEQSMPRMRPVARPPELGDLFR